MLCSAHILHLSYFAQWALFVYSFASPEYFVDI